ncbi:MAG: cupredoxin domain-containing protein [bacterium]|nr:cupredoxin domain-containing protein [bacterium]
MSSIKKTVIIGIGVLVAIGAFAVIAMNGAKKPSSEATTPVPTAGEEATQATPSGSEAQMVTVEGTDYSFSPSTITLTKDKPVTITFKNNGKFPHNLVITDLGVSTDTISPGKETTVEFVPEEVGTFEFVCGVGNHEEKGMVGEVVVQ